MTASRFKKLRTLSPTKTSSNLAAFIHNEDKNFSNEIVNNYYMPVVLANIIMEYLEGDVDTQQKTEAKEFGVENFRPFMLFGKNLIEAMAARAARLILTAEESAVKEVLILVKNNPAILNYTVQAQDPKGRKVKGRLIEIAAMAEDIITLRKNVERQDYTNVIKFVGQRRLSPEEIKENTKLKSCGLVQMIIEESKFSSEEAEPCLKVITSEVAKQVNDQRNQRIINATKTFGEGIITKFAEVAEEKDIYNTFQNHCKPLIEKFESDLQDDPSEVISLGYIFDIEILHSTAQWYEDNLHRFGGRSTIQSSIFCILGLGKLQGKVSARVAQLIREGVGEVDQGGIASRTLKNDDGSSYFYNPISLLGIKFYIGYRGLAQDPECELVWMGNENRNCCRGYKSLVRQKKESIENMLPQQSRLNPTAIVNYIKSFIKI